MQKKEVRKVFNRVFDKVTILPSARRWSVPAHEIGKVGKIIYDDGTWIGVRTKYIEETVGEDKDAGWRMLKEDVE